MADIKNEVPGTEVEEVVSADFTEEENQDKINESSFEKNENENEECATSTFEEEEEQEEDLNESDSEEGDTSNDDNEEDKYSLLQEQYDNLKNDFDLLNKEVVDLRAFKATIEEQQKQSLIDQFYMLSDEDKKDVIENRSKYTLEEIEAKLAVICYKKKVNFNLETSSENEDSMKNEINNTVITFDINDKEDSTPDWVKAVESTMNGKSL